MNMEKPEINQVKKEEHIEEEKEFNVGDRVKVTWQGEERLGRVDLLPPNLPEGTVGVIFDDGKREAALVENVEKVTEEAPEEKKEDSEE